MTRMGRSWQLVKASFAVLRSDKELLVFPILSGVGMLFAVAAFGVPMFLAGFFDRLATGQADVDGPVSILVLFLFYVVTYTITFFANAAVVGAALMRLEGRDPTVADGMRIAREHLWAILGYAVIAATVGMVLRLLSKRGKALAQLVAAALGGLAWSLATFLVVPVLVVEGVGPVEAIKRSTALLKRTWGEQIVGRFGIGIVFGPLFAVVIVVGVLVLVGVASTGSVPAIALVIAAVILVLLALGLVSSTVSGIYTAAVYRYATTGDASGFFPPDLIKGAFEQAGLGR